MSIFILKDVLLKISEAKRKNEELKQEQLSLAD